MRSWELTADKDGSSSRAQLFFEVEDRAKNTLEQEKGVLKDIWPSALIKWHSELVNLFVRQPLEDLGKAVNKLGFNRFFFAFDECGYLNQVASPEQLTKMSLTALMYIIKATDSIKLPVTFWHLLLDTSSHISEIAL